MDRIFGLPAHPLLVHIPIVLLPLAAAGVVVMLLRPAWRLRYRWAVLAIGIVGAGGSVLTASAGEELETRIVRLDGPQAAARWQRHADLGETARNAALLFAILLAAYVLVPWYLERRSSGTGRSVRAAATETSRNVRLLGLALAVLAVLGAAASVYTIVLAGHTGSESVWEAYVRSGGG